jgi:pimeloyl-ACP methyl ester carboxylesterase
MNRSTGENYYEWAWHFLPSPTPSNEFAIKGTRPTVIFVHHFGGNRLSLERGIRLVHRLGLDAVWFPLLYNSVELHILPPAASNGWGFGRVWTNQVVRVLRSVQGPKILFTLSMPSNSAMVALAENPQDVICWICDGGPFQRIFECVSNLFIKHFNMKAPAAYLMTAVSLLWYGRDFQRSLPEKLFSLPTGFPVLSLRGEKDHLVSPEAIDDFFATGTQLRLIKKSFAEGGHLDLLKRFPREYEDSLREFLNSVIHQNDSRASR